MLDDYCKYFGWFKFYKYINYQKFRTFLNLGKRFVRNLKASETFRGLFLFKKLFQNQLSLFLDENILISTLLSTSDIYRSSVTSDFKSNSYKRVRRSSFFYNGCCQFRPNGKISWKLRKFGKIFVRNICLKLSKIPLFGRNSTFEI